MALLTDARIRSLRPREKVFREPDGRGLCVEVQPSGTRCWRYRYRFAGKPKMLGLGTYPEVSLMAARRARDAAEQVLGSGADPSAQRRMKRVAGALAAVNTFEAVAAQWFQKIERRLAPATIEKIRFYLKKDLIPTLGKRPIAELTRPELVLLLRKIERRKAFNVAKKSRDDAEHFSVPNCCVNLRPATWRLQYRIWRSSFTSDAGIA